MAVKYHAAAAVALLALAVDPPLLIVLVSLIYFLVAIAISTLPQELLLLFPATYLTMEQQANALLAVLRNSNTPLDVKLTALNNLKAHIKHYHVPEAAVSSSLDVISLALSSHQLLDAGFSILSHLTKRLILQEHQHTLSSQATKIYPPLLDRLGDQKDRNRVRAIQALVDLRPAATTDVEQLIRDSALTSKISKTKESALQWVVRTHNEQGLQFRSFVPNIIDCLEDADGSVRDTSKATVINLFENSPDHAKTDLKKKLQERNVRKTIAVHILSHLGLAAASAEVESASLTQPHDSDPPRRDEPTNGSSSQDLLPSIFANSTSEHAGEQLEPVHVDTHRELEEIFRDMHPCFEGKESEQNWSLREKSILKLRKVTKGNAPHVFSTTYLACFKALLDGILKTVNSLRTTVSTNGCLLVQDAARAAGPGLDNMVEILLQNLIKLCGGTKKISAQNGNITVDTILANVSYNVRLIQHIWSACQDKNVQPRSHATGWLKTIITKHGHKVDHGSGLDLIEKCVKKGLADANPGVRGSMRPTYWAFAALWADRSNAIIDALDKKQQDQLRKDPSNPSVIHLPSDSTKSSFSRSTTSVPEKPSLKETIAAQKRAKLAGKPLVNRPESAQSTFSPSRPTASVHMERPASSMATVSKMTSSTSQTGSLSSAPVRPMRPPRRPELHWLRRPGTAEPHTANSIAPAATPPRSQASSPTKNKPKTPAAPITAIRSKPPTKKVDSPLTSAIKAKIKRDGYSLGKRNSFTENEPTRHRALTSPTKAAEDLTMVLPSLKTLNINDTPKQTNGHKSSTHIKSVSESDLLTPKAADASKARPSSEGQESSEHIGPVAGSSSFETRKSTGLAGTSKPTTPPENLGTNDKAAGSHTQPIEIPTSMGPHGVVLEPWRSLSITPPDSIGSVDHGSHSHPSLELEPNDPHGNTGEPVRMSRHLEYRIPNPLNPNGIVPPGPPIVGHPNSMNPFGSLEQNGYWQAPNKGRPRKSISPHAIYGRKENIALQKQYEQYQGPTLQVYEDPDQRMQYASSNRPQSGTLVLTELPINEPSMHPVVVNNHNYHIHQHVPPQENYDVGKRRRSNDDCSHCRERLKKYRSDSRTLESGINRLRTRTLDIHGLRKMMTLIQGDQEIWEHVSYEDLLMSLLDCLENQYDNSNPAAARKSEDLHTQVYTMLNIMVELQTHLFAPYYPRVLCAYLTARKHYKDRTYLYHLLVDSTLKVVNSIEKPDDCIDAVLDLLETEEFDAPGYRTMVLGLKLLESILLKRKPVLSSEEVRRLGKLAIRCVSSDEQKVRKTGKSFVPTLHDSLEPRSLFWDSVKGAREDHRNIIEYHVAKDRDECEDDDVELDFEE